jgi:type VI protein secretion system component Hcp
MSKQSGDQRSMNQSKLGELSDQQLGDVAGGMTVTKTVDAPSPTLFQLCYQGKHIPTGKLAV